MLIPATPQYLTNSLVNPRQIAANSTSSSPGGIIYTVPAGKKFVGYIYGVSAGAFYSVTPSGGTPVTVAVNHIQISQASTTPFQIVFIAGTIITNMGTSAIYLNGIESDL
ncbi:hypothetical protein UFOVP506_29 [uncultured Caudovirales phage]|uniref:Uncharacterized protein n=1 Tax=uncultured Caudovirales phage TaxID=2100421 RepID=A0A6J5MKX9_9CAUD|nr:hypothetical protein UFOVP506_29 [uncultured Caudovirales phage]